jgi:TPR repeat protein
VGSMDIVVTLMLANGSLADRETLRLEWRPRTSAMLPSGPSVLRRIDAQELKVLLARGNTLVATGDLAPARLVLQRAAEAGNARAAFMLMQNYDPVVLEKLGELGLASNVAMARIWYSKAKDLGSEEAPECLERLARRSD